MISYIKRVNKTKKKREKGQLPAAAKMTLSGEMHKRLTCYSMVSFFFFLPFMFSFIS